MLLDPGSFAAPLVGGFVLHALLWQFAEPHLQDLGEKLLTLLTGKPVNQYRTMDSEGIPIVIYRDQGRQYNPLFVAALAKRVYAHNPAPTRRKRFIALTDWLLNHAQIDASAFLLPYHFDLPELGLRAPWYSPLAQSVALTALAQRYALTQEDVWLDYCTKILNTLSPGSGLALRINESEIWFPEYPSGQKTHVLNGMAAVLIELNSCWKLAGLQQAQDLFDQGYNALIKTLSQFDFHGFSYYSLDGTKASRNYHQMHIRQLRELNAIRPHPVLRKYQLRWQFHDFFPVAVQLFFNPRPKRIAAFLTSLAGMLFLFWLIGLMVLP